MIRRALTVLLLTSSAAAYVALVAAAHRYTSERGAEVDRVVTRGQREIRLYREQAARLRYAAGQQ